MENCVCYPGDTTFSYTGNFIPSINIPRERWVKNYDKCVHPHHYASREKRQSNKRNEAAG